MLHKYLNCKALGKKVWMTIASSLRRWLIVLHLFIYTNKKVWIQKVSIGTRPSYICSVKMMHDKTFFWGFPKWFALSSAIVSLETKGIWRWVSRSNFYWREVRCFVVAECMGKKSLYEPSHWTTSKVWKGDLKLSYRLERNPLLQLKPIWKYKHALWTERKRHGKLQPLDISPHNHVLLNHLHDNEFTKLPLHLFLI